ncbi:MAG: glycosyltransferase family 4 protein [Hyphomicrobiaceae bacterium]
MTKVAFAIPGDIDLPTGGYAYDRRVLTLLPSLGIEARHLVLPGSYPQPTAADLAETGRLLGAAPSDSVLLIDGLAYGAMPADLVRGIDRRIVALVHHPLCLEAGLSGQRQDELRALETAALALAQHVIVTSQATAKTLVTDFAVSGAKITVAEPGTDAAPRATGTHRPLQLLGVGSIVPRKAFDSLVRALKVHADLDWRLKIVGSVDRSAEALDALKAAIAESGLQGRITLTGPANRERLDAHYAAADVFVMPSLYEGYGMVLAEAMARGLPIVCTTGGAAADTAPNAAALKVPPGDVAALSAAIGQLLRDATLRASMGDASWSAGRSLPRWEQTARTIADVVRRVAA